MMNIAHLIRKWLNRSRPTRTMRLCPFHVERTPSMMVISDGTYHCFGCGRSGRIGD